MRVPLPRRRSARFLWLIFLAAAIAVTGLAVYFGAPAGEVMAEAEEALISDADVSVSRERWIVFAPHDAKAEAGFIFYPGGRVPPEAYAPLTRAVAEAGFLAVITPMPLNLAVLDIGAASAVIEAYPQISTWVIGGHSLGGAMAARYAYENQDKVDGLVLLAAYPEAHIDFREGELAVVTVYGDHDGLASVDEVEGSFQQLATDALKVLLIEGGNHAQFGWYGAQAGDQPAGISRGEQQRQVLDVVLRLMREAGK